MTMIMILAPSRSGQLSVVWIGIISGEISREVVSEPHALKDRLRDEFELGLELELELELELGAGSDLMASPWLSAI